MVKRISKRNLVHRPRYTGSGSIRSKIWKGTKSVAKDVALLAALAAGTYYGGKYVGNQIDSKIKALLPSLPSLPSMEQVTRDTAWGSTPQSRAAAAVVNDPKILKSIEHLKENIDASATARWLTGGASIPDKWKKARLFAKGIPCGRIMNRCTKRS